MPSRCQKYKKAMCRCTRGRDMRASKSVYTYVCTADIPTRIQCALADAKSSQQPSHAPTILNHTAKAAQHHTTPAPSTVSDRSFGRLVPSGLVPFLRHLVSLCFALSFALLLHHWPLCMWEPCAGHSWLQQCTWHTMRATGHARNHTQQHWMRNHPQQHNQGRTTLGQGPSTVSDRCFGRLMPRSLLPFLCGIVFLSLALFPLCCCSTGTYACGGLAQPEACC
jgi:hypothetical protein